MRRRCLVVLLGTAALVLGPTTAASAHPLGNFTVNTADRLQITADGIDVLHVVDTAEIPTGQLAQARQGFDLDGDGALSPPELDRYAMTTCTAAATELQLAVAGSAVPLTVVTTRATTRPGVAGLPTTRLECLLRSPGRVDGDVSFSDPLASQRNGWREVTASSACGPLTDSTVPEASRSDLLLTYPTDLLSSPLDVTSARFTVTAGGSCRTVGNDLPTPGEVSPRGLDRVSRTFTDFLSRPDLTVTFAVASVLASLLFGVLHALAPGHGKTVMAAYLVGQRGTRRQALQLGAVVTFTHTASVLLLGAVLALGAIAAPELVVPATEVISGVLLAAVGVYLLVLALRKLRHRSHDGHDHDGHDGHHGHDHDGHDGHDYDHDGHDHDGHDHDGHDGHDHHGHDGHDGHDHDGHDHEPARELVTAGGRDRRPAAALPRAHSHGGRTHTHAPLPDGPLSWKALAGMGVAGGLVPSPSALLVLLSATALGRAWFGVVLVIVYGVGMAVTLTAAGLLLVRAQAALDRRGMTDGRLRRAVRLVPVATAALVLLLGLVLVARGVRIGSGLL